MSSESSRVKGREQSSSPIGIVAHTNSVASPAPNGIYPTAHLPRQVPLSKCLRRTMEANPTTIPIYPLYALPKIPTLPRITSQISQTTFVTSISQPNQEPPSPSQPHIPRPPNAFMLFRSDFLKRGVVPSHVERRQQNLSRIAGEIWNTMLPEEKAVWHREAAEVLAEHHRNNPNYKFTPAPRGSRRLKTKSRLELFDDEDDAGHQIRESYTQIPRPVAMPDRRRKRKVHKLPVKKEPTGDSELKASLWLSPTSASPSSSELSSPSSNIPDQSPALPPFFPQYSFPHLILERSLCPSVGLPATTGPDHSDTYREKERTKHSSGTGFSGSPGGLDIIPTLDDLGGVTASATSPILSTADTQGTPGPFTHHNQTHSNYLESFYPKIAPQTSQTNNQSYYDNLPGNEELLFQSLDFEGNLLFFDRDDTQQRLDLNFYLPPSHCDSGAKTTDSENFYNADAFPAEGTYSI